MPKGIYTRSGAHAPNFRDLTGLRFGKRIVLSWNSSPVYRGKKGSSLWNTQCDCGTISVVTTSHLKTNTSCGCDLSYTKRSGISRRSPIPEKIRDNDGHRRRMFGLSPETFNAMRTLQNNRCKICLKEFTRTPQIDHDHACCPSHKSCGKCIRGLLCNLCNSGLGNFHDSLDILQRAINYLKATSVHQTQVTLPKLQSPSSL